MRIYSLSSSFRETLTELIAFASLEFVIGINNMTHMLWKMHENNYPHSTISCQDIFLKVNNI